MALPLQKPLLEQIYQAALQAVDPGAAVERFLRRDGDWLLAGEQRLHLPAFRKVFLVGVGKAGIPMAQAVEKLLGSRLEKGLVVVRDRLPHRLNADVLEAGHPEPDAAGLAAASRLERFLDTHVTADDLLLMVVSGGGSALLPAPVEGITLEEKRRTTQVLLHCGATIHEINAIRKHLSRLKGGRLLEHTRNATVISMLLSDVVGDDPASIASGPTAADPTTFQDCLEVIERYQICDALPASVVDHLQRGSRPAGAVQETPKPGDQRFARVENVVIASNRLALQAAADEASRMGLTPLILSSSMQGNTAELAGFLAAVSREILTSGHPVAPPCCVICGGETTLKVQGAGKGGRNQEMTLWFAQKIAGCPGELLMASIGSDGNDGPTDAAGAFATTSTAALARQKGLSIQKALAENDSYHFFQALDQLIVTGPTHTNVMDFQLVLILESSG